MVKGTVRDPNATEKLAHLHQLSAENGDRLELIKMDLLDEQPAWDEAVKDCTFVIHTASPVTVEVPKDESIMVKPAVTGAQRVIQACGASTTVKRVVFTSSEVAIMGGWEKTLTKAERASKVFTEEDWSIEAHCPPYPKSKLKAEQAAWDYVKSVPERNLELVVINPCYILGPLLTKYGGYNSRALITRLLKNDMPGIPSTYFTIVDVRDAANAHVVALTHPNAPGNRFLCYSAGFWMKEIATILRAEFSPQGYKIPNTQIPNAIVWVVSLWDPAAENIYPKLGKKDLFFQ